VSAVAASPDPEPFGPLRSKTVTWHDPVAAAAALAGRPGLDALRAVLAGEVPPPPMAVLLNISMERVEPGLAVFTCTPDDSMYNPLGVVHGGLVCTLADTVLGCAVHSTLEAGLAYTSIDIDVSYLRPVRVGSGTLTATGRIVRPGRRVAFAAAEIADAAGKLVATATGSCLVFEA
jgi:uncharacterized protein (TIGR00369 family)